MDSLNSKNILFNNINNINNKQNQQNQLNQQNQYITKNQLFEMARKKKLKNKKNKTEEKHKKEKSASKYSKTSLSNKNKKKYSVNRSLKVSSSEGTNLPAFFQKNFSNKSNNIMNNSEPVLKTAHKSYYPTQRRVIVIGDVHGDLDKLIDCLILSKCIQLPVNINIPSSSERTNLNMFNYFNSIKWTGKDTYIVQVGDQIDRIRPTEWDKNKVAVGNGIKDEGSSLHIFYLLWYVNTLAKKYGGRVISLLGNHEFMNVEADYRYVSPYEFNEYFTAFNKFYNSNIRPENEDQELINNIKIETSKIDNVPKGYLERRIAFNPRGIIANFFALNYKTLIQIGKWVFVHAGLTMNCCRNTNICKINNAVSRFLLDIEPEKNKLIYKKCVNSENSDNSPVWNRDFGETITDERENRQLSGKYSLLIDEYNKYNSDYHQKYNIPSVEYLGIGHTPQFFEEKGINSTCNGKVWRCDVGMSKAFGSEKDSNRKPQVLEILNDDIINVLS
tara:strand:+ start:406 stop:1911 length:1506 start_codon:yes stop_codon:yes gene_type:complete